jgi:hypothetical protein
VSLDAAVAGAQTHEPRDPATVEGVEETLTVDTVRKEVGVLRGNANGLTLRPRASVAWITAACARRLENSPIYGARHA